MNDTLAITVAFRACVQFSPNRAFAASAPPLNMRLIPNRLFVAGVLWFTAEGTGQTPQNTSKLALIDTQPALWAQLTLLATTMKNGLGVPTLRARLLLLLADCAGSALLVVVGAEVERTDYIIC